MTVARFRTAALCLALLLGVAPNLHAEPAEGKDAAAQEAEKPKKPKPIKGEFVRAGDGTIVLSIKGKKKEPATEQTVAIGSDVPVKVEGEKASLGDIQPGMQVSVTLDDSSVPKSVSASWPRAKGTFVRLAEGGGVVLLVKEGKGEPTERTFAVASDAKVRVDKNKSAGLADLQPGMEVSLPQSGSPAASVEAKTPKAKDEKKAE